MIRRISQILPTKIEKEVRKMSNDLVLILTILILFKNYLKKLQLKKCIHK